tara:strand:- start:25 stop:150 length:126 start_codon:yes stop_codon:yes gene_type:complete
MFKPISKTTIGKNKGTKPTILKIVFRVKVLDDKYFIFVPKA